MDKSKKHIEARIRLAKSVQTRIRVMLDELTVLANHPIVGRLAAEGIGEAIQRLTYVSNHATDTVFESLEVFVDREYRVTDVWLLSAGVPETVHCTGYDKGTDTLQLSHGVGCHPEEFKKHLLSGVIEFLGD